MLHTKDKLSKDAYTCIILVTTDMKKTRIPLQQGEETVIICWEKTM